MRAGWLSASLTQQWMWHGQLKIRNRNSHKTLNDKVNLNDKEHQLFIMSNKVELDIRDKYIALLEAENARLHNAVSYYKSFAPRKAHNERKISSAMMPIPIPFPSVPNAFQGPNPNIPCYMYPLGPLSSGVPQVPQPCASYTPEMMLSAVQMITKKFGPQSFMTAKGIDRFNQMVIEFLKERLPSYPVMYDESGKTSPIVPFDLEEEFMEWFESNNKAGMFASNGVAA